MTARILVVDDEPDMGELIRQNFRREVRSGDYTFDFVTSGDAAMDVLRSGTPPRIVLVLSDINMPGMSGLELLAKIRRQWPDVSVFMITAYADAHTRSKSEDLGADYFVTKPIDFEQLRGKLAEALGAG